ncbi:MAG: GNAT family N-acetyltransferase [Halofilum sp. (in: g-proteobacteria)]|nr:GNAT family N-acetyltransferase [Halofilum sp. (in: g-proteobacteria)]
MSRADPARIDVRPVTAADADAWRPLFDGYARFYGVDLAAATAERVWGWLVDPGHRLEGLIAHDAGGAAVGIAHVEPLLRPLAGTEIGFLHDLYVDPAARGGGAADALFDALAARARERGWPAIRWLTQEFNYRGRAFYDRYTGAKSDFVMYQWTLE